MLATAFLFTALYTVFGPIFLEKGKRHFFIGLTLLIVLGILLHLTDPHDF